MKLRLAIHVVIVALFVAAGLLAAFVGPAQAGFSRIAAVNDVTMEAGMPCCPSDQGAEQDCTKNCPASTFCLAKASPVQCGRFATVPLPVAKVARFVGNDADRVSRTFEPPAKPPRS